MASNYQGPVEQLIIAGEQIHQIVNGTATTEVTAEVGSYSFTFIANKNGRVVVRRNNTSTANRNFEGTVDVKIEIETV